MIGFHFYFFMGWFRLIGEDLWRRGEAPGRSQSLVVSSFCFTIFSALLFRLNFPLYYSILFLFPLLVTLQCCGQLVETMHIPRTTDSEWRVASSNERRKLSNYPPSLSTPCRSINALVVVPPTAMNSVTGPYTAMLQIRIRSLGNGFGSLKCLFR